MRSLLAVLMAGTSIFAGMAAAQDSREISGELTYRQRIALPDDALVVLELRDERGRIVTEERFPTGGKQVPLGFLITGPKDADLVLQSAIFVAAQPAWVTEEVKIPAGSDPVKLEEILLTQHQPMGFATTWTCGGREVTVGYVGDIARMKVGADFHDLAPVQAASGAKFVSQSDPGTWVWSKGNDMSVSLRGQELADCAPKVAPATATFTARGNEPGWALTIAGTGVTLNTQDGTRVETTLPEPEAMPGGRRYTMKDAGLVLTLTDGVCRDTMTGMPHPASATLEKDGQTLKGCAGAPVDLLKGVEWVVEDIAGGGIIDSSHVTLSFGDDGTAAGSAGCNRFFSGFTLTGEGMAFQQAGSTMMACAPALMEQEHKFLATLATVDGFDISDTGALLLMSAGKPVITARN